MQAYEAPGGPVLFSLMSLPVHFVADIMFINEDSLLVYIFDWPCYLL